MFNLDCTAPNRVKITLSPDGALENSPSVSVDNDATVVADPANPTEGKGPFVFHVSVGESFTPSNVTMQGDADPDPTIAELITDTGIINWRHPHATTLGANVEIEPPA